MMASLENYRSYTALCDYSLSCIKMNLYFERNDLDTKILNI